jgi:hypothetical protein
MKSKDIHRLWIYINNDLGYKVGPLPFQRDDSLSDNAYEWAHPDSTTKRPLLISDAIHENPMLFHSTVMTVSGRTHPGWERDPFISASFPMYTEHRINLSAFVTNPKSKRLEPQIRLIQIQPTLISPGSDQFWTPILILSGLGNNYSQSKCCITSVDPDFGERFTRSVQLDWSFFQFNSVGGNQRTQPFAVLKVCKNNPDDQTAAATDFILGQPHPWSSLVTFSNPTLLRSLPLHFVVSTSVCTVSIGRGHFNRWVISFAETSL